MKHQPPSRLPVSRAAIGIDMASEKFDLALGVHDAAGAFQALSRGVYDNTPAGVARCVTWCRERLSAADLASLTRPATLVVEVTGVYHERLLAAAHAAGVPVCLVLPLNARHFRLSRNVHTKTDRQDAALLAEMGCERALRAWVPASPNLMLIRALLRQRQPLLKMRLMTSNQVHAAERATHRSPVLTKMWAKNIQNFDKQIAALEAEARRLAATDAELWRRVQLIARTVPGLGWLTVLTVIAETNGFSEITSGKQLASYAGLDVVDNQSGKHTGSARMSKRGNAFVRKALYMPAMVLRRTTATGPIAEFGRRVAAGNPNSGKKATVAIMRKLLLLIRTLWDSGEAYDPDYEHRDRAVTTDAVGPELDIEEAADSVQGPVAEAPQTPAVPRVTRGTEAINAPTLGVKPEPTVEQRAVEAVAPAANPESTPVEMLAETIERGPGSSMKTARTQSGSPNQRGSGLREVVRPKATPLNRESEAKK